MLRGSPTKVIYLKDPAQIDVSITNLPAGGSAFGLYNISIYGLVDNQLIQTLPITDAT